jgi:peptidoglycan/LPS O-acetylase OafA/YrhL
VTSANGQPAGSTDGFRPDLEGLRAVAVVLVLLYHAAVPGFAGGYVGVDVFFVLSGFLITGLLLREVRRTGTISLPAFYARRARRLLPASALVLLVTVAASAVMLPPLRVPDVTADAASAALYVSNIRFAFQATDYLQSELAPSPILHFWSLSVEEQFYLFWPAILLLVARGRGDPGRRVALVAGAISVASFLLALWLTGANQPWAFFSLPTRAWELGLGAFLAIGATQMARLPERPAAALAWAGLALVALSGVVLSTATPFPGLAALLPTVGSALVIAGGFRQPAFAPGRWLAMAIPRFLGRISYSLYLWHWPLLVLPAAALGGALPWWARGALVALAIVLAAATQRWVEDPLRHGRRIGTVPRRNLAMAGGLSVAVAVASLGIGARAVGDLQGAGSADLAAAERELSELLAGLESARPADASPTGSPRPDASGGADTAPSLPATADREVPERLVPSLAESRSDQARPYDDGCHAMPLEVESPACEYGDVGADRTIVLFGDSHALAWFPAVERFAEAEGWRLVVLTKSACQSVDVDQWYGRLNRVYDECLAWRSGAFDRIDRERPDVVVLTNHRQFAPVDAAGARLAGAARVEAWRAGMARTIERLREAAGTVVVIADTPRSSVDPPECLSAHPESILACSTSVAEAADAAWLAEERAAAARGGAAFVDPTTWVCPSEPCPPVLGSFLLYRDPAHLTTAFSATLADRLGAELDRAVAGR